MKPSAAKVVVFLLLGAIVNVAVAWGCYQWRLGSLQITNTTIVGSDLHYFEIFGTENLAIGPANDNFGILCEGFGWSIKYFGRFEDQPVPNTLGVVYDESSTSFVLLGHLVQAGWPDVSFVSLRNELVDKSRGQATGALWPGFAINTIFYAAILWMVLAFPFVVRRRRRIKRGLCPACAYPVGTSPVCTECGGMLNDIGSKWRTDHLPASGAGG